MEPIKICIIDDHKIVRKGLAELLEKVGNIKVVKEFENGIEFLEAIPLASKPDMYILDYSMPELNGIEILKILETKEEEFKVLLLTQHFDEKIIDEAYYHGARGFLKKTCNAQELKFAIDNINSFGYTNIREILKRVKNYEETSNHDDFNQINLSVKEHEFLTLVCSENEYTYIEMSDIMKISVKTIENIRLTLFNRYKLKSKVGLVLFSFKNKLTPPFL